MSLKARFKRIEAGVCWLEIEGRLLHVQAKIKLFEMLQEISDHIASDPVAAEKWKKFASIDELPPPRVPVIRPAPPPLQPILLGVSSASARKRLDALCAPQDEEVRVEPHPEERPAREARPHPEECEPAPPPRPPPPPDPAIHPYDPPEHMQIRPTRWRVPGPADYDDDAAPGTNGQCVVDYDPLAGEDDDGDL